MCDCKVRDMEARPVAFFGAPGAEGLGFGSGSSVAGGFGALWLGGFEPLVLVEGQWETPEAPNHQSKPPRGKQTGARTWKLLS